MTLQGVKKQKSNQMTRFTGCPAVHIWIWYVFWESENISRAEILSSFLILCKVVAIILVLLGDFRTTATAAATAITTNNVDMVDAVVVVCHVLV